ncbi:MAG: ABC transporter substrate-binding protein [Syntrophomonadaceae bacterium]|jgi:NitT/TauT family transport system substrate-binding protein
MKRIWAILLIVFCSWGFGGCASTGDTTGSDSPPVINIGVMPDVESIPFLIAEKNGYFDEEGVKVNIEHFKSAKDRDSALQSGKLDGVITDIVAVVFANEGGIDLKMISKNDGDIKLLAGKGTGIKTVQDLPGKDLGLSTNTIMEYTADQMLADGQLNPQEVSKIGIPQLPTRLEMLQGGKVSAIILPEPLAGVAVANGATVLKSTDQMNHKAGAIAFTGESIEKYPEEIKAVFRAYNRAVDYLAKEPTASYADYIIEKQGFPPQTRESFELPQYDLAQPPDQDIVDNVLAWMKAKELIKGDFDYYDLVDDRILGN